VKGQYQKRKALYQSTRGQLAHPDDNTMCAYCGTREHAALHHEDDFQRASAGIRQPSNLTRAQLRAEVKRCTREDGTKGLVAVCLPCHHRASKSQCIIPDATYTTKRRAIAKNKRLDDAAKLACGGCECDEQCCRAVTAEDVYMFEWDHLVQSFNDPSYRAVGHLVNSGRSVATCDRERAKCRLLYFQCHHRHSAEQYRYHKAAARRFPHHTAEV
jgi:hypothetical protein